MPTDGIDPEIAALEPSRRIDLPQPRPGIHAAPPTCPALTRDGGGLTPGANWRRDGHPARPRVPSREAPAQDGGTSQQPATPTADAPPFAPLGIGSCLTLP